jgi:hypothetical protein
VEPGRISRPQRDQGQGQLLRNKVEKVKVDAQTETTGVTVKCGGPESACIPPAYSACLGSSLEVKALAMARVVVGEDFSLPKRRLMVARDVGSMRDVGVGVGDVLSK